MRGTHRHGRKDCLDMRIIPADAGNTRRFISSRENSRDHPRGCGEHSSAPCVGFGPLGSSPRMRGTLSYWLIIHLFRGIIPADAGNTLRIVRNPFGDWDHPRGCGEHIVFVVFRHGPSGSSPRMRGTQVANVELLDNARIIPADAGNTLEQTRTLPRIQDHPRGCGEHAVRRARAGG